MEIKQISETDEVDQLILKWQGRKALLSASARDQRFQRRAKPSLEELRAAVRQRQTANAAPAHPSPVENALGQQRPNLAVLRAMATERQAEHRDRKHTSTRLQQATANWLGEVEWNLAMTLTFDDERGVSYATASTLYGKFLQELREIVLRKGSRKKIQMAAFIEDSREQLRTAGITMDGREGTHIHVLLRVRGDDPLQYKDAIARAWRATNGRCGDPRISCPNSNKWFQPLLDSQMRENVTGYFLKDQAVDTLGLLVQYLHLD